MKLNLQIPGVEVHSLPGERVLDWNAVQLWVCDLDEWQPPSFVISNSERGIAMRLKMRTDARRFIARSHFVRTVLGNILCVPPEHLEFAKGPNGKPELLATARSPTGLDPRELKFNLSHSQNILALAVALNRDVGIDVEVPDERLEVLSVAQHQFSPAEFASLRIRPANEVTREFYRIWTRKEAAAKATGRGIALDSLPGDGDEPDCESHSFHFHYFGREVFGTLALRPLLSPIKVPQNPEPKELPCVTPALSMT